MNCQDAREWLPALTSGTIGLTEWALVEAHLRRCPECRGALEDLLQPVRVGEPVAVLAELRGRVGRLLSALRSLPASTVAGVAAECRLHFARAAHLGRRLLLLVTLSRARTAQTGAALVGRCRLHIARAVRPRHRLPVLLALPRARIARVAAAVVAGCRLHVARAVRVGRRVRSRPFVPPSRATQAIGLALVAAFALYQPGIRSARTALPDAVEQPSPSLVSTPPPEQVRRAPGKPAVAHVVGRLSVKDRSVTERDLTALLVRTGGTELGRRQDLRTTVVDAVVPQSGYSEFTHGLARIGSWQVEAERSPLPTGVHVTIRVGE